MYFKLNGPSGFIKLVKKPVQDEKNNLLDHITVHFIYFFQKIMAKF
jgi:hypothetical protein